MHSPEDAFSIQDLRSDDWSLRSPLAFPEGTKRSVVKQSQS
jgi:hypothetical protein